MDIITFHWFHYHSFHTNVHVYQRAILYNYIYTQNISSYMHGIQTSKRHYYKLQNDTTKSQQQWESCEQHCRGASHQGVTWSLAHGDVLQQKQKVNMNLLCDVTFTLMQIVLHKVLINYVYYDVTSNSFILVKPGMNKQNESMVLKTVTECV